MEHPVEDSAGENKLTPERTKELLTQLQAWARQIIAEHPKEEDEHRSAWVTTGTEDEHGAGIFSLLKVEEKGTEIVIDIEHTQYGDNIAPENRQRNERFLLTELTDGSLSLEESGLQESTYTASLFEKSSDDDACDTSYRHDEHTLQSSLRPAQANGVIRLADYVEVAMLGDRYTATDWDDVEWISEGWRYELEEKDGATEKAPPLPEKRSFFTAARNALGRVFKQQRGKQ